MDLHDHMLIIHSLKVLEQNAKEIGAGRTACMQLALRILSGYVDDDHALQTFWQCAGNNGDRLGRRNNLLKILEQVKSSVKNYVRARL